MRTTTDDMGVTPLRRYGRHLGHCPMAFTYPPTNPQCTCGLEQAIAAEAERLARDTPHRQETYGADSAAAL